MIDSDRAFSVEGQVAEAATLSDHAKPPDSSMWPSAATPGRTRSGSRRGPLTRGRRGRSRRSRPISARLALVQFAAAGVLAFVLLALIGLTALQKATVHQAITQATNFVAGRADQRLAPVLIDEVITGQPTAVAAVDRIVREQLLSDRVVRVKLWTAQGRIVYSDEPRLINAVFPLAATDRAVLTGGRPDAELSSLTGQENAYERSFGRLLQIYTRIHTTGGQPMLLEVYLRFDSITANAESLGRAVVPAFLLALLALQLLQLPLAWRLVRRISRGHQEREALNRRVMQASDHERRRIARDLHDGVVQSLAGLSYNLTAVGAELSQRPAAAPLGAAISDAARATRANISALRTLIFDINPPNLQQLGLPAALDELAVSLTDAGIQTTLSTGAALPIAPERAATLYRAAQEAVRNIIAHSGALHAHITVTQVRGHATLIVSDDGSGFHVENRRAEVAHEHFGLSLLEGLAGDAGGHLEIQSIPGGGTTVTFTVPLT
jgi:two-component system NarL family sensor kinase